MDSFGDLSHLYLDELERVTRSIDLHTLERVAAVLWSAYEQGNTIYFFGNGGSAATTSHFVTDLGKGTLGHKGDLPAKDFRAISLTDNVAMLTAWSNKL